MDPITAVGLVGSVVGITDIVVRSLNGLRSLQAHYNSADRRVAITRGNLQSVKGALDEIREWAAALPHGAKTTYASLLQKIDFAVQCCAIPLESLCESIESLNSKADGGGLSRRGKLAVMLGEADLREMSIHLGNQVQALNLLLMAAFCKTQGGVAAVLQDEETRSILRQVEDDSASYIQTEIETLSVMTRKSVVSDLDEHLDLSFDFDGEILDSQVYRQVFETIIDERRGLRRPGNNNLTVPNRTGSDSTLTHRARFGAQGPRESPHSPGIPRRPGSSGSGGTVREAAITNQVEDERVESQPVLRDKSLPSLPPSVVEDDQRHHPSKNKVLLLGTKDSGKTTLLRQMKLIHRGSWPPVERLLFRDTVLHNLVRNMRCILEVMESVNLPLALQTSEDHVQSIFKVSLQQTEDENSTTLQTEDESFIPLCYRGALSPKIKEAIVALWADPGVRKGFERSRYHQLDTNAAYWFNDIERIAHPYYIPTDEDMLRVYVRTTGISDTTLYIDGLLWQFLDFGGSRSERKKWSSCFENVTAVVFLVAISEYDQSLYEDDTVNRIQESLHLFDSICNLRWFAKSTMILFFNKIDVFKDKLLVSPMENYFPDYKDGAIYEAACDYILDRFVSLNQSETRQVYTHFICALDKNQVRFAMAAVDDIVIQESVSELGLL